MSEVLGLKEKLGRNVFKHNEHRNVIRGLKKRFMYARRGSTASMTKEKWN